MVEEHESKRRRVDDESSPEISGNNGDHDNHEKQESHGEHVKPVIPEGMSKSAWKKLQKRNRWEESKEEYREMKKEKRKEARARKVERRAQGLEDTDQSHQAQKRKIPQHQQETGVNVLIDCEFDDLMSEKEVVSLSNQITRCYSAMRHSEYKLGLTVSPVDKRLKQRFDGALSDYKNWKDINFLEDKSFEDLINESDNGKDSFVYLTADTEEELTELEAGKTYIIGGIVDKNRHKNLCVNKAKDHGVKVAKLPIGKYIEMNCRHVLATSHVYELMCMWYEKEKNWEAAFNEVLPPRKIKERQQNEQEHSTASASAEHKDTNDQLEGV